MARVTQRSRIITVTGTKGKTSVVRALAYAMQSTQAEPILAVDTHKILLGGKKLSSFAESKATSGLVPTVCPGRFLLALKDVKNPVAVLEASVGSSRKSGLGYRSHEIGIFTNVYDDHLGMQPYLRTRRDLARAKSFIFKAIKASGYAIFNADEPLIVKQLKEIDKTKNITKIACTLDKGSRRNVKADYVVSLQEGEIRLVGSDGTSLGVAIERMPWLNGGRHEPSLYNGLFVVASLWAFYRHKPVKLKQVLKALELYQPDSDGSRMVVRRTTSGANVIIDFAHEAESLSQIARYARTLSPTGKVVGVVRISGERPGKHIKSTARKFVGYYDELVIYEKEFGEAALYKKYDRQPGEVAALISQEASNKRIMNMVVLGEEPALKRAAKVVRPGDSLVYVPGGSTGNYERVKKLFEIEENEL